MRAVMYADPSGSSYAALHSRDNVMLIQEAYSPMLMLPDSKTRKRPILKIMFSTTQLHRTLALHLWA